MLAGGRPVRVVSSATAALEIALRVCGIGPGDEVITPAMTFFAAPNMIVKVGATPVFVDVEPGTRNLDIAAAEARIGPRTKAIMPTHFAGLPCDMDALYALASGASCASSRTRRSRSARPGAASRIGSFGDICVFSFHPNKNITTIEGGALVVNDEREAQAVEVLRFHGITRLPDGTRDVAIAGGKFNLPDVNAAIGLRQLAQLGRVQREAARARRALLRALPHRPAVRAAASRLPAATRPATAGTCSRRCCRSRPSRSRARQFRDAMEARGIGTGVSYEAAHLATAFRRFGYHRGDLPHTERIADTTVTLPLFPTMTDADVDRVCDGVRGDAGAHAIRAVR